MKIQKLIPYFLLICFTAFSLITVQYGFLLISNYAVEKYIEWHIRPESIPYATHQTNTNPSQPTVLLEFVRQAERANWNINEIERGWAILKCESKFVYDAKNPKSSALGVAQYIDSTWKSVAPQGESRLNYRLSIALFIQNFPTTPKAWSECL